MKNKLSFYNTLKFSAEQKQYHYRRVPLTEDLINHRQMGINIGSYIIPRNNMINNGKVTFTANKPYEILQWYYWKSGGMFVKSDSGNKIIIWFGGIGGLQYFDLLIPITEEEAQKEEVNKQNTLPLDSTSKYFDDNVWAGQIMKYLFYNQNIPVDVKQMTTDLLDELATSPIGRKNLSSASSIINSTIHGLVGLGFVIRQSSSSVSITRKGKKFIAASNIGIKPFKTSYK